MKNLLSPSKLLSGVLCICVALSSCKKGSDGVAAVPPAVTPTAAFTYKADGGATVTVDSANAVLYNLMGSREMDVYAFKGGLQVLEFHFAPTVGNKNANPALGGASSAFLTYDTSSPLMSWDGQSGAMNLTTCDTVGNKIIGDFNFVAKVYPYTGTATKTISEGHMYVTRVTKL